MKAELLARLRNMSPTEIGEFFRAHPEIVGLLEEKIYTGSDIKVSEDKDELMVMERGFGKSSRPEDYLESFKKYLQDNADRIPALVVVQTRPSDLTRAQLRELRLILDAEGFSENSLRVAVKQATSRDIAASIIGYIRHAILETPLIPHEERVEFAMQKILASRDWNVPQRKWLENIGKQLKKEIIVDREALDSGLFRSNGGFDRINKFFDGELDSILQKLSTEMWEAVSA